MNPYNLKMFTRNAIKTCTPNPLFLPPSLLFYFLIPLPTSPSSTSCSYLTSVSMQRHIILPQLCVVECFTHSLTHSLLLAYPHSLPLTPVMQYCKHKQSLTPLIFFLFFFLQSIRPCYLSFTPVSRAALYFTSPPFRHAPPT